MKSHFFIAPPGAGKTSFKLVNPNRFIDPEESINWKLMDAKYTLYPKNVLKRHADIILEHELDWPTVWNKEVLPRLRAALILEKNIIMGMIAPSNVEIASRFLKEFRKNTTLILPKEEIHFQQVWNHEAKRIRTWGPHLRGWQHTFWTRLLLLGLATDLSLHITQKPKLSKVSTRRKAGLVAREAGGNVQNRFVEVFFGRWAELNKNGEIVAMHIAMASDKDNVQLKCDRTAKKCGRSLHKCGEKIILRKDVNGHALTNWIAQDKVRSLKDGQTKNALIFFAGTLAPFHHGHIDALNAAKSFLESRGWNIIGGYASVFKKINERRSDDIYSVLGSTEHRNIMLQLGVMGSDWLMADFPVQHVLRSSSLRRGEHPAQRLAKRLRECGALSLKTPITTFWVNGKDAHMDAVFFNDFVAYAEADPLNPLRLLIIDNRSGEDMWSKRKLSAAAPALLPFVTRCKIHQVHPTSATAIRNSIKTANRNELNQLVGLSLVESYLIGLMDTYAVRKDIIQHKTSK
ncbi:MAG: hypothetical protein HYT12_00555 [Candidatus Liptonbacteria bacterium]|nr:hypothetical protein [Candidatus Liptonbacteria bacterium]